MVLPMVYPNGQGKNTSCNFRHVRISLRIRHLERHSPAIPAFLHLIVKHGEHPYLTPLQPDKLVCIEYFAFTIQTGEIAAKLFVLRVLKPKKEEHCSTIHPCIGPIVF